MVSQPTGTTGSATEPVSDLARLPLAQLHAMQQAGLEILQCYHVLQKAGLNLVGEVLRDTLNRGETFYEFNHYPDDDVYDRDGQLRLPDRSVHHQPLGYG